MEIMIEARGEVVEREELLNGTQIVTFEGASDGAQWRVSGTVSWNIGLEVRGLEGDMTLTRDDGASVFATVTGGAVEAEEGEGGGYRLQLEYEVDGGTQDFNGRRGSARADGVLSGDDVRCTWRVTLTST